MPQALLRHLALLSAVTVAACAQHQSSTSEASRPIRVTATQVKPSRFVSTLDLSGTVSAGHSVTLGANAAGRIVGFYVRVGDHVVAGDTVAQIDTSAYRAALEQAQGSSEAAAANQRVSLAQLAAAQSRLQLAQITARRMTTLYAQGAIAKQQQDETQADLTAARAAVAQAQAASAAAGGQVAETSAGVAAAQVPLAESTVRAPFSGIVTARFVDAGAVVAPGSQIVSLDDTQDLEIDLNVPESAAPSLTPGAHVPIHIDALDRTISGRIRAVVPSDNASLHAVLVKVSVPAESGMLPGMFARVSLPTSVHFGPAVPASALVTRAGQNGIFVISGGHARFVPVDTGATASNLIEVHSAGMGGALVAISNLEQLTDGAAVGFTKR